MHCSFLLTRGREHLYLVSTLSPYSLSSAIACGSCEGVWAFAVRYGARRSVRWSLAVSDWIKRLPHLL
jgi:hypothetical protein